MREQAGAAARIDFPQRGGVAVDAMEQSAAVQTLALLMARCLTQEELSITWDSGPSAASSMKSPNVESLSSSFLTGLSNETMSWLIERRSLTSFSSRPVIEAISSAVGSVFSISCIRLFCAFWICMSSFVLFRGRRTALDFSEMAFMIDCLIHQTAYDMK